MNITEYNQALDEYAEWQDFKAAVETVNAALSLYSVPATAKITIEFEDEGNGITEYVVCTHGDKVDGRALAVVIRDDLVAKRNTEQTEFEAFTGTDVS